jgi:hypothetical protein
MSVKVDPGSFIQSQGAIRLCGICPQLLSHGFYTNVEPGLSKALRFHPFMGDGFAASFTLLA